MFALFGAFCLLLLQATMTPAQLITLRDGKIGVNFAGYHADAGLGGLLTGNAAHGGLSASAGTPWGSRAAAGLGGSLDGRTAGGAYAAAQANDDVGASAVLGGSVGEHGYIGSEAHVPGKVRSSSARITPQVASAVPSAEVELPPVPTSSPTSYVQRVKPPKKYSLIAPNSDHSAASDIDVNRVKAATVAAVAAEQQQQQATPVIIVKRPRLRVKQRPARQRQRIVYVEQPQEEKEQQVVQEAQPQLTKQASLRSDAKVVHTQTRTAAAAAPIAKHTIRAQQQTNIVGQSLQIPIGILQSLQQSFAGFGQPPQPQQQGFQG